MKRDMDLVRQILMKAEDAEPWTVTQDSFEGWDPVTVARHIQFLSEAGYLTAGVAEMSGTGAVEAVIDRLLWEGHDFLAAVRSDTVWNVTKTKIAESVGAPSLEVVKAVAVAVALQSLRL